MYSKVIVSFILFFLSLSSSFSQDRVKEIDKLVNFCHVNGMFNGNILIAEKGEIIYHKSFGKADFNTGLDMNVNHTFCVGSIAKQFTAFGIMLLRQEGKIKYSDTVGEIFPELPKYMHPISIKNLMQHTSGLKRTHYENHPKLDNAEIFENLIKSEGDSLLFQPGTEMRYSNSAFMLLALIVEKVSGQSFESYLQENAWTPLGMTNTYVKNEEDQNRANQAVGYNGYGKKDDFDQFTYGSNGIYSSTEDLFRWMQSFSTDLLMDVYDKDDAWQRAISNTGDLFVGGIRKNIWNYGFGLAVYKDSLDGLVGHSGAFGGFLSNIIHDFKNDRDIVILTNNGRMLPIIEVGISIHHILSKEPYKLPQLSIDYELRRSHYDNVDKAITYYKELKKKHPTKYKFDNEWELNAFAYALMADDRLDDAIKMLKLLISEFPNRPNPRDSMGEAYHLNGQYKKSTQSYQKALEIDPLYNTDWINGMLEKNREMDSKQ